jgi:hypothetical protein
MAENDASGQPAGEQGDTNREHENHDEAADANGEIAK